MIQTQWKKVIFVYLVVTILLIYIFLYIKMSLKNIHLLTIHI